MSRNFMILAAGLATIGAAPAAQNPAPAAVQAQLPIEAFALIPRLEGPQLSPNGQQVLGRTAVGGRQYLAVTPVSDEGFGTGQHKLISPGNVHISWWRWVNDDWIVVGTEQHTESRARNILVTRALGIRPATGEIVMIPVRDAHARSDRVVWTAKDGTPRVATSYSSVGAGLMSGPPKIEEMNLETKERKIVQFPTTGMHVWHVDADQVVRLGFGSKSMPFRQTAMYRERDRQVYRDLEEGSDGIVRLPIPELFTKDAVIGLDDNAGGYRAIYRYDPATLKRGAQLHAVDGYDIDGVIKDDTEREMLGYRVMRDRMEHHWTDPAMVAMQKTVSAAVRGAQADIVSVSRDKTRAIVRVGGADAPGGWFRYDKDGDSLVHLTDDNAMIGFKRLHPVKTIRYKARDGLELSAVVTTPRGRSGKLPMIVIAHDGPYARASERWDWWAQFLADRGYLVIQPNYRGSTGFGAEFMRKGERAWGRAMQDDLDDAVGAMGAQVDPARVCIAGIGYGGYSAMRAAQRGSFNYRCAISYGGISDLEAHLRYRMVTLGSDVRLARWRNTPADVLGLSPVDGAKSFSIPMLLVHGDMDRTALPDQSRTMAEKLKAANKPVTYVPLAGADGHFSRSQDRLAFLKALEAFLAEHNPA